jgi:hypothetical protein
MGAGVSSVSLEFRTGSMGAWALLTNVQDNPFAASHVFNAPAFFTSQLNYRYTVMDTQGATTTTTSTITPQSYAPPTISLSISATPTGVTGEGPLKRERGNTDSQINGSITRQRVNVPITSYSVQYSLNNSAWSDVPGLSAVQVLGNPASITIPTTLHSDPTLIGETTIYYRVVVDDIYATTYSPPVIVHLLDTIWYGPVSVVPATSSDVRSLTSHVFTDAADPLILNTGNVQKDFTIALPQPHIVTEVVDLDALNAVVTSNYPSTTLGVKDAGGTTRQYNIYTMSNAIPYTGNHRHQFKRT